MPKVKNKVRRVLGQLQEFLLEDQQGASHRASPCSSAASWKNTSSRLAAPRPASSSLGGASPCRTPFEQDPDPVADGLHHRHHMGGHHHRPALVPQDPQQVQHGLGGEHVQPGGGFVEHHHLGVVQQGPGDGHLLLLAAREALHADVGELAQVQELEQVQGATLGHPGIDPLEFAEQPQQLPGGEPAVDAQVGGQVAHLGPGLLGAAGRVHPADLHHAPVRAHQPGDHAQGVVDLPAPLGPSRP